MRKNKGFSLIELIAVIAIMATLTGLLVPQFVRYVTKNREDACRDNRETILNIFEKCVYAQGTDATGSGVTSSGIKKSTTIIPATDKGFKDLVSVVNSQTNYDALQIPNEYKEQIKSHWNCPQGGTFTVGVTDEGVAYVECDCDGHNDAEDKAVVDLVGWIGGGEEYGEPSFDVPTLPEPPEPEGPPEEEPPEEEQPAKKISDSYYPYADDPRWDDAGRYSGSIVSIEVPSGKFASKVSNADDKPMYFVAIAKSEDQKTYDVSYERGSYGPMFGYNKISANNGDQADVEQIILWSGRDLNETNVESIKAPGNDNKYYIKYGDIYTTPGGERYVYASYQGAMTPNSLPADNETIWKTGNWYKIKKTDE